MERKNAMESITVFDFIQIVLPYANTMPQYELEKRVINKVLSKINEQLFKDYVSNLILDICVKAKKTFLELDATQIIFISPEIVHLIEYISYEYEYLNKQRIIIRQLVVSKQSMQYKSYLQLTAFQCLYTDRNRLNVKKIDSVLLNNKKVVHGAKKSSTGTLFGIQTSRYFKPKPNKDADEVIGIEKLRGKKNSKNYLIPGDDEIIVARCPICGDIHKFVYEGMQKVLQYDKARNVVKLRCNHKLKYGEPFEIDIAPYEIKNYNVKDILMFIINNRRYFGLQKPRCKA
jgi:hypothetical protein